VNQDREGNFTHAIGSFNSTMVVDGMSQFVQQFSALYMKNALVAWRNWRATSTRLLAPLILLILALAIDESLKAKDRDSPGFLEIRHPEVEVIAPIPMCNEDMYIAKDKPCEELAYSPDNSITREIMDNVVSRNGKPISARAFPTREAVQDFLFDNPDFMIGAVHFVFDSLSTNATLDLDNQDLEQIEQFLPPGVEIPDNLNDLNFTIPPFPAALEELPDLPDGLQDVISDINSPDSNIGRRLEQQFTIPENEEDFTLEELQRQLNQTQGVVPELQGFIIQTNTTIKNFKGEFQHPNAFVQVPLQNAVHREIARYHLKLKNETEAAETLEWNVGFKPFPSPALESEGVLRQILGPFVFAALMFSFVIQISTVVIEKELKLRQALRTMGMSDMSYWVSWGAWEITLAFLQGHLVAIFGLILQFDIFHDNNYGLLFFLFFLFQLAMSSFALLLASFLNRTQAAVYLGFVVFIVGWIMQAVVVFGVPYTPDFYMKDPLGKALTIIFSIFPWSLLVKGFNDLGMATTQDYRGLAWDERRIYCQEIPFGDSESERNRWREENNIEKNQYIDFECKISMDGLYTILIILWIGFFVVAVYLDNVLKNEVGLRRNVLYFLFPSYWFPSVSSPKEALSHVLKEEGKGPEPEAHYTKDEDVMAEESITRTLLNHRTGNADKEDGFLQHTLANPPEGWNAIEVYGLKKNYGGSKGCCGRSLICSGAYDCCSCRAQKNFWPVKDSWFVIPNNQLFCLLGPNGAGKTTTINMLIGMLPPTYGDALIRGQSIRSNGGLNKIRSMMGVCPQFDVLWPELTGREHLLLYGRIKSAKWNWSAVNKEADMLLEKVKLTYAADLRTGAYSGGMRRRLSVAIALLGDPKVVYLDEPTTGMDPISRRFVWDTIQEAKVGRAIILTTHSMEEADILGDRIAIMALGRLRCIGSSLRLKQRFGAGFQVSASVQASKAGLIDPVELERRSNGVKDFFYEHLKLDPTDINKTYINYLVPRAREDDLVPFLEKLESKASSLNITDIQLSLASLEEVFLTIARYAAVENAKSEGMQGALKELPFGSTCLKACLLGLFFPITIWVAPWWKRIIVGKEDLVGGNNTVVLPDGTTCLVEAGQEQVQDSRGMPFDIIWSLDDEGLLRAQDVQPASRLLPPSAPTMPPADAHATITTSTKRTSVCQSATSKLTKDGKATIQFPDTSRALFGVEIGERFVVHPSSGQLMQLDWGEDAKGQPTVHRCNPLPPQKLQQPQSQPMPPILGRGKGGQALVESRDSGAPWSFDSHTGLPVAHPVDGQARMSSVCSVIPGAVPHSQGASTSSAGHG